MNTEIYIIPDDTDLFLDFECIVIYLISMHAIAWGIPCDLVCEITEQRTRFESIFFHSILNRYFPESQGREEFNRARIDFQLALIQLYDNFLLNNVAITDEYKSILSIKNRDTNNKKGIRQTKLKFNQTSLLE